MRMLFVFLIIFASFTSLAHADDCWRFLSNHQNEAYQDCQQVGYVEAKKLQLMREQLEIMKQNQSMQQLQDFQMRTMERPRQTTCWRDRRGLVQCNEW